MAVAYEFRKITPFDGSASKYEEFKREANAFKKVADALGTTVPDTAKATVQINAATHFVNALTGQASAWLHKQLITYVVGNETKIVSFATGITDEEWNAYWAWMDLKCGSSNAVLSLLFALFNTEKKHDETPTEFIARFTEQAETIDPVKHAKFLLAYVAVSKLEPMVARGFLMNPATTMGDLNKVGSYIHQFEAESNMLRGVSGASSGTTNSGSSSSYQSDDKSINAFESRSSHGNPSGFRGGYRGSRRGRGGQQYRGGGRGGRNKDQEKCHNCGGIGHYSSECASKKLNNKHHDSYYRLCAGKLDKAHGNQFFAEAEIMAPHKRAGSVDPVVSAAMWDSGANISVIKASVAEDLRLKIDKSPEHQIEVMTFIGSTRTVGKTRVRLRFPTTQKNMVIDAYVLNKAPADVLLGTDIMDRHNVLLEHGDSRGILTRHGNKLVPLAKVITREEFTKRCLNAANVEKAKQELAKLIEEFKDIFPQNPTTEKGFANLEPLKIDIDPTVEPSFQVHDNYTDTEREFLRKWVKVMKDWGKIEVAPKDQSGGPRQRGWNSRLFVVSYGDGKEMRPVFDGTNINKAIYKWIGSLPRIDDILQWIAKFKFRSKSDIAKGYWSILLHEDSRKYFRFIFEGVQYQCCALPQGANLSPVFFQQYMDRLFADISELRKYIDDLVMGTHTMEEHLLVLRKVFTRVREANLKLNVKKSHFLEDTIEMFGFDVSYNSIAPAKERAKAMKEYPKPDDPKRLQRFVKSAAYFRGLIKNFAKYEQGLMACVKDWNWTPEVDSLFEELKQKLVELPSVVPYKQGNPLELHCDASQSIVGAILVQVLPDGQRAPVWYYSSQLTAVEKGYSTYHREFTAVYKAVQKFHSMLHGKKFVVFTDHEPLVPILRRPDRGFSQMKLRWAARCLTLMDYDFHTEWVKGENNVFPDAFSRINAHVAAMKVSFNNIKEAQEWDGDVKRIRLDLKLPFFEKDGVLYRYGKKKEEQLVLPSSLRKAALEDAHRSHAGIKKMIGALYQWCWWPSLREDTDRYYVGCHACQFRMRRKMLPTASEHIQRGGPWEMLIFDFCGPFPNGQSVVAALDPFTGFLSLKVVKHQTAEVFVNFTKDLYRMYGAWKTSLYDNGAAFVADATKRAMEELGIGSKHSSAWNPQGHGPVERTFRSMRENLRVAAQDPTLSQRSFKDKVAEFASHHNSTIYTTTGFAPFKMFFGRDFVTPLQSKIQPSKDLSSQDYPSWLMTEQTRTNQEAEWAIAKANAAQDRSLTQKGKVKHRSFKPGDMVLVYNSTAIGKMENRWEGPWEIVGRVAPQVFRLRNANGKVKNQVNVKNIKIYVPPNAPKQEVIVTNEELAPATQHNPPAHNPMFRAAPMPTHQNWVVRELAEAQTKAMHPFGLGNFAPIPYYWGLPMQNAPQMVAPMNYWLPVPQQPPQGELARQQQQPMQPERAQQEIEPTQPLEEESNAGGQQEEASEEREQGEAPVPEVDLIDRLASESMPPTKALLASKTLDLLNAYKAKKILASSTKYTDLDFHIAHCLHNTGRTREEFKRLILGFEPGVALKERKEQAGKFLADLPATAWK